MTTQDKQRAKPASAPQPASHAILEVLRADGRSALLWDGTDRVEAVLAEHVLTLEAGQKVAALLPYGIEAKPLIIAAYPPESDKRPGIAYDPQAQTLTLSARCIRVVATDKLELSNDTSRVALQVEGTFEVKAERIISAAIETHRIEGGAIELN